MAVCLTVQLDARLEHKLKALAKHHQICEALRQDIRVIESEKHFVYSNLMKGRGAF